MKSAIVIPARFASSRLPGKPLLRETGKYLIQHVYERACESNADTVIVATDDARIAAAVRSFGGKVMMTRDDHPSGTDRVAEVAAKLDADIIVNVQGDEPMIEPASLDLLTNLLNRRHHAPRDGEDHHAERDAYDGEAPMATLATPIASIDLWRDPNCVKVVCDEHGNALYFSRSPIPFVRDGEPDFRSGRFLHHLGLYAYRRSFLLELAKLPPTPLEQMEKLEQLRVLALGYRIQVGIVPHAHRGVDTPADYQRFVDTMRAAA